MQVKYDIIAKHSDFVARRRAHLSQVMRRNIDTKIKQVWVSLSHSFRGLV